MARNVIKFSRCHSGKKVCSSPRHRPMPMPWWRPRSTRPMPRGASSSAPRNPARVAARYTAESSGFSDRHRRRPTTSPATPIGRWMRSTISRRFIPGRDSGCRASTASGPIRSVEPIDGMPFIGRAGSGARAPLRGDRLQCLGDHDGHGGGGDILADLIMDHADPWTAAFDRDARQAGPSRRRASCANSRARACTWSVGYLASHPDADRQPRAGRSGSLLRTWTARASLSSRMTTAKFMPFRRSARISYCTWAEPRRPHLELSRAMARDLRSTAASCMGPRPRPSNRSPSAEPSYCRSSLALAPIDPRWVTSRVVV